MLAAVARAGVDVAEREAAVRGAGCGRRARGGGGGGRGAASASAVGAGVAELEALVDEREVGQQVAGGGVGDGGPVRVGAGPQAQPRDAVAVALDDAARRAARALDAADADRLLLAAAARRRPARPGRRAGASRRSNVCRSSSARCSSRAWTSPAARVGHDRLEARRRRAAGCSRGRPRRARPRARPARRRRGARASSASTTPMSRQPVLERGVEEELAPGARRRPSRSAASSVARAAHGVARRASSALPPTRTVPNRKRWPVSAALSRRARSVSAANGLLPAAKPTPAQTAAMSLRWFQMPLELEQDRARAGELGGRRRARAPPRRPARRRRAFVTAQAAQARAA